MLMLILLSLAVATQGQYPYPPAASYPPAVRVAQPVTHVAQPVAIQSGRLQASHFRSGPYPPAEPVQQVTSSSGPYPPAQPFLLAPTDQPVLLDQPSIGPYPPAQPFLEGGEISPVEQNSPRVDHTTYSLPSQFTPEQIRVPTQKYPLKLEEFRSGPASYPTQYPGQYQYPTQYPPQNPNQYPQSPNKFGTVGPLTPKQVSPTSSFPSYPSRPVQSPSSGTPTNSRPKPFQSGGEVSPEELEIPPNSQINLQDKRLQYSHGFSDDKGTQVKEQGSLLSTNDGWEYVIAKKGSYSYTSPEGKFINVNYIADHNGFRVLP